MNKLHNVEDSQHLKDLLLQKKEAGKIDEDTYNQILASMESAQPSETQKAFNYVEEALMGDIKVKEESFLNNEDTSLKNNAHRTKAKSNADEIKYPDSLAIPTISQYQYAMSVLPKGNAYLQAGINMKALQFKDGKLFFADSSGVMQRISEVELQNFRTSESIKIDDLGLSILRAYYSILLHNYKEAIIKKEKMPKFVKLYLPDLAEYLGLKRNFDKKTVASIMKQMRTFHNVVGVMHIIRNGNPDKSYYPVLNFEGYDAKTNTIEFASPYLFHIIDTICRASVVIDKKTKKPKLKKSGEVLHIATHSYLVHSSISSEKNQAAVENVINIVTVIEQAGDNTPHIKASTLIERNPKLKQRLEESKNPIQLLQRTFKRTWELLREQTKLIEVYKNIQLPDPNDSKNIPTMKTLEMVFEFPHEGKKDKSKSSNQKSK